MSLRDKLNLASNWKCFELMKYFMNNWYWHWHTSTYMILVSVCSLAIDVHFEEQLVGLRGSYGPFLSRQTVSLTLNLLDLTNSSLKPGLKPHLMDLSAHRAPGKWGRTRQSSGSSPTLARGPSPPRRSLQFASCWQRPWGTGAWPGPAVRAAGREHASDS